MDEREYRRRKASIAERVQELQVETVVLDEIGHETGIPKTKECVNVHQARIHLSKAAELLDRPVPETSGGLQRLLELSIAIERDKRRPDPGAEVLVFRPKF